MKFDWRVFLGAAVIRLLAMTWRIRRVNDASWRELRAHGKPWIFVFWHGDLLTPAWAHRNERIVVMVSEHRDGAIIAGILERFGNATTRGSTTRGGARALLGLIRAIENGASGAITPDGPRGPRHAFQPGVLAASQRSGAPIIAMGIAVSRAWQLKSWDAFTIPKPFARICIGYSDPMPVTDGDDVASFTSAIHAATARAQDALARV